MEKAIHVWGRRNWVCKRNNSGFGVGKVRSRVTVQHLIRCCWFSGAMVPSDSPTPWRDTVHLQRISLTPLPCWGPRSGAILLLTSGVSVLMLAFRLDLVWFGLVLRGQILSNYSAVSKVGQDWSTIWELDFNLKSSFSCYLSSGHSRVKKCFCLSMDHITPAFSATTANYLLYLFIYLYSATFQKQVLRWLTKIQTIKNRKIREDRWKNMDKNTTNICSLLWIQKLHISHFYLFSLFQVMFQPVFSCSCFLISFPITFLKLPVCIQTVFSQRFKHICVWKAIISGSTYQRFQGVTKKRLISKRKGMRDHNFRPTWEKRDL